MKDLKDILALLTPVALAIIAYLQVKASQKTKEIQEKQKEIGIKVDGMTEKLVTAEKGKSDAEGQLKGMAAAKAELIIPIPDIKVALKDEVVEKVAEKVVETVKKDPEIKVEVKREH